jgi:hypothetical protein
VQEKLFEVEYTADAVHSKDSKLKAVLNEKQVATDSALLSVGIFEGRAGGGTAPRRQ